MDIDVKSITNSSDCVISPRDNLTSYIGLGSYLEVEDLFWEDILMASKEVETVVTIK